MRHDRFINHEFVDLIPRPMEAETLYVSMDFATASHLCFCGCGAEVVTPLSPVNWQLWYNGEVVSLTPSVGSWSLPCQSHYWIKGGKVVWAGPMSARDIAAVRRRDMQDTQKHYGSVQIEDSIDTKSETVPAPALQPKRTLWMKVKSFFQ